MILSYLATAILSPLAFLLAWKCWRLPPAPAIRIWALAFAGMTLAMLLQMWQAQRWQENAQAWQSVYYRDIAATQK